MSISEIVNYVNRTPHNTNPNVIASMVQGTNEQAVYESVEKLKQDGGVGYLGRRFFTFDGNTEGKNTIEPDGMILYNIANEAPDLNTIVKVRGVMDGQLIEVTGENFEIQSGNESIISVSVARWQGVPFVATTTVDENSGLFVHPWLRYIEFEDAVHIIAPKYLPGEAKPQIIDLTKFPTNGGIFEGADINMNLLYLCNASLENGGAVREQSLTFDDDEFCKKCASKGNVIIKSTLETNSRILDAFFPTTVSIERSSGLCMNMHAYAVLNLDGLVSVDTCFIFGDNGRSMEMIIKATPFV